MSGPPVPSRPGSAALPPRDAPPQLVRRLRIALLAGHAWWTPAPGASPSPLDRLAERLAAALPAGWRVAAAVHRSHPSLTDALEGIEDADVSDLVVLSPYPCFTQPVGGEIARELYGWVGERARAAVNLAFRGSWYDDIGYVAAQAAAIAEFAASRGLTPSDSHLLFTAGTPPSARSAIEGHDPYLEQAKRSTRLIAERLGWADGRSSLAFAGAPAADVALEPHASIRLAELLEASDTPVLLCTLPGGGEVPIAGPSVARVHRCPPLDTQDRYVGVLRDLVLRGVRPVLSCRGETRAPVPERAERDADHRALIMVGAELAADPPLAPGHAELRYSTAAAFLSVKQSRKALRSCLERLPDATSLAEGLVWETCQRIELYGWLSDLDDGEARERAVCGARRLLFASRVPVDGLEINVLCGVAAWRHLMRAACGLESRVAGDTDVVAQLATALHVAQTTRAAGPRAARLVADAAGVAERVRAETPWGACSTGYCRAALATVPELRTPRAEAGRHVVVGGSTTSRSILTALAEEFGVPQRQLTLVYRDHHGQLKLLRAAVGQGRRLRVHTYSEPGVVRAMTEADFVYFGLDTADAVLDPRLLHGQRDYASRPLTIVDFNSFASLGPGALPRGVTLWSGEALERAVAARAAAVRRGEGFQLAAAAAERWIECHSPSTEEPACHAV